MQIDPELSDEIRRFEEQYAENPDSLVFARLADLHRKAGRPERALEILDGGLERHPDYLSAHIVRARCLRALDRTRASEDVFRHVLELDGENLVALRSLAEMAWERGDGTTARDRLEELLELDPRNEEARDLLEEIRGGPAAEGGPAAPPEEGFGADDGFGDEADVGEDVGTAGGTEHAFGREDDPFLADDDPFAADEEAETFREPDDPFAADEGDGDDAFAAPDDPFAADGEDEFGDVEGDEAFGAEPDDARDEDEDLIIEPTSRRESREEAPAAGEDEEEEAEGATGSSFRTGSFRVEPVEGDAGSEAPGAEAGDVEVGPDEPAAAVEGTEEEQDDRWWDFLRPGGGADESEEAAPEPMDDPAAAAPADEGGAPPEEAGPAADEATGGPAVGPAEEAEQLRAQIEELRMRAEQETDLSDADQDLATETLANLYEAQGFYREAVEMYEELAAQRPDDEDLRRRLERAREALEETGEAAAREAAEASASSAPEEAGEVAAGNEPAPHEAVTAAGELRAVLRGEASPEGRDSSAP